MGHKLSDGNAIDVSAPASNDINKGDLYRIAGWNGIAMDTILSADTDRGLALETSPSNIWKVKLPAGVTPVVGQVLYWTTVDNTTFQKGDTHLLAAVLGAPACKVLIAKNAAGYAAVRVLNLG